VKVTLLGTGKMGAAIARRVAAAGFELTLWNRTVDRARAVGVGRVAERPEDALAGAEIVLSMLYDADAVRDVYARIEPAAAPGQLFVEMSTAGPDLPEELARRLAARGAELLASPVVGSIPAIEQGTALVLVGGDQAAFERARPVLGAFGQPEHVGGRRDAACLKLVNNAYLSVCNLAAAELMAAARRAELDLEAVFRLLSRLVPYLQARRSGYMDGVHEPPLFQLDGWVKDLDLAMDTLHRSGAAAPVVALTREIFAAAVPEHGGREVTAVIERYP
jgi:3-hydroxyisobutyrate dehydrogenase